MWRNWQHIYFKHFYPTFTSFSYYIFKAVYSLGMTASVVLGQRFDNGTCFGPPPAIPSSKRQFVKLLRTLNLFKYLALHTTIQHVNDFYQRAWAVISCGKSRQEKKSGQILDSGFSKWAKNLSANSEVACIRTDLHNSLFEVDARFPLQKLEYFSVKLTTLQLCNWLFSLAFDGGG